MKGEGYPLVEDEEKISFRFKSEGQKGIIEKVVEFSPIPGGWWNLAFGDAREERFDDEAVSNNLDIRKVIQTVANSVHIFLEAYPERQVLIVPVDAKRRSLYNRVFQQHWEDMEQVYSVKGISATEIAPYSAQKLFDAFLVSRKELSLKSKNS